MGTILGAVVGGFMAYYGSLKATKLQLTAREKELAQEREAKEREAAQAWFHQQYLTEGVDRVWVHTMVLRYTMGLANTKIRQVDPPPVPIDALVRLYDLFGCDKITITFCLLDLAARPIIALCNCVNLATGSKLRR